MIGERYGRPLTLVPGHEDERLIDALNEQNIKVQTGHIEQLSSLTHRNGTVHFADTMGEMRSGKMLL